MSTFPTLPTTSSATYPPDLRVVAEQLFLRLLQRDHPPLRVDPRRTWLAFYTLKNLAIPPFTHFPADSHAPIQRALRQHLRSESVSDTLLDYFLNPLALERDTHVGLFRAVDSVAQRDEVPAMDCPNVVDLYTNHRTTLEAKYRERLATYWTDTEQGKSRRALFIAEHVKALLLESETAVEQGLLTTSQQAMLRHALETSGEAAGGGRKHGIFHLLLADADAGEILPGAFVLTHAQSLQPPGPTDRNLGEVLLRTERQGLEGFDSVAQMVDSLAVRFNDATQKQVLLQNLSEDQRERIGNRGASAASWRLAALNGDVLQTLFDLQVARQQTDFSQLLRKARATKMPAQAFVQKVHAQLAQAAHLDNAFMLERNDRRLIGSNMPPWWSQTDTGQQQRWVQAAQHYGHAIIQLHQLCSHLPNAAQTDTAHLLQWRDSVRRLATAQLHMGDVQAQAEPIPAVARAWIKAVLESPDARHRKNVGGKAIRLDFMTLGPDTLADVMRIAPAGSGAHDPLLICTLNAPDSQVFRWFPDENTMRENFLENPDFARYLLLQLPEASRPVMCTAQQYEQWLRYFRAGNTFSHLTRPTPLPGFRFAQSGYVDEGQDFLHTHHDLKHARSNDIQLRTDAIASHGSILGSIALGVAMLFIPSPVLITLALGVAMFKAWNGFKHVAQGDYKGAAFEFICATGYLLAAAAGKWMANSRPFAALENLHPAPPLVLRTAADGEEQISYLASHDVAPYMPTIDSQAPYDAEQFRSILIQERPYFVKKQPWLFGHHQLYEVDAQNPDLLIGEQDYAVQDRLGNWRKIPSLQSSVSNWLLKRADAELGSLTHEWPASIAQVSPAMKSAFEASYLQLAKTSNAEEFAEICDYCEGGSDPINTLLRAGLRTPLTSLFMKQFYCLHEYRGLAFRAVMVSPAGLRRLTTQVGQVFVDNGVQSASITRWNAEQWSRDEFIQPDGATVNKVAYLIFDASIAKKNLFTAFLGDHVAIAPSTPLQLVASRLVGERFFAYFKRPLSYPTKLFSLYSGNTELML